MKAVLGKVLWVAGLVAMPLGIVYAETGGTLGEGLLIAAVGFLLIMIGRGLFAEKP